MRDSTMLAAAALAVAVLTAAFVAYPGVIRDRPLNEFRIDMTQWSCSTTTNGRVLSCVRNNSL